MTHEKALETLQTASAALSELAGASAKITKAAQGNRQLDPSIVALLDPGPLSVASGGIADAIAKVKLHQGNLVTLAQSLLKTVAPAETADAATAAAATPAASSPAA